MWCCCSAHGTAVLVNGLNTVYFIFQQVLWLKAWVEARDASLLFLLSLSFCAVASLFQLSVCARTIWHGSVARQCVLLSKGKIINHNLDGEGVRDGFYFHFRADSSTGRQFFREGFSAAFCSVAWWVCEERRPEIPQDQVQGRSWEQRSLAAQLHSPSLLSCCRSLALLRITFFSTAGLQTVVLGTKFVSLGSAPLCRVWSLQTVNFKRHGLFFFPGNTNILALLQQSQLCKHWSDYLQNIWGRILLPKEWVAHKTCSVLKVTWKDKPNGGFYELPPVGIFKTCNLVRYLCTSWPCLFACQGDLFSCGTCGGILQLWKVFADCEWWETLRNVLCLKQLPPKHPSLHLFQKPPCMLSRESLLCCCRAFFLLLNKYEPFFPFLCFSFF